jgi:hypothetical protein
MVKVAVSLNIKNGCSKYCEKCYRVLRGFKEGVLWCSIFNEHLNREDDGRIVRLEKCIDAEIAGSGVHGKGNI